MAGAVPHRAEMQPALQQHEGKSAQKWSRGGLSNYPSCPRAVPPSHFSLKNAKKVPEWGKLIKGKD
jgi:hypothetical protein